MNGSGGSGKKGNMKYSGEFISENDRSGAINRSDFSNCNNSGLSQ
jgi:hypothetical protein